MNRYTVAAISLALAMVTFLWFPGHTWLQQDSQIYAAILVHQSDPGALRDDPLVAEPHVAFTLYDEVTRAMRAVTRLSFEAVLGVQQVVTRALGIWGLYLMALALGSRRPWLIVTVCALGAMVAGPQVLTFEYEPTPRAFAIPLVICGIGLAGRERWLGAAVAGAAAFLYHPPSAAAFCVLFAALALFRKKAAALWPLGAAILMLLIAAHGQASPPFFGRIPDWQERLQRMRAAYNWISLWPAAVVFRHIVLFAIVVAAYARLRREMPGTLRVFAVGLPLLGVLSMPASWLLLDRMHWVLMPQVQPMRLLLFGTLMVQFLGAAAGVRAAIRRQWPEAAVWFAVAYAIPFPDFDARHVAVLVLLVLVGIAAARYYPAIGLAAFVAIPLLGGVVNYPHLRTPQVQGLVDWARTHTSRDAIFLFPDAGHDVSPGIFRVEAERALFVDWKSGGQVNYFPEFAREWGRRWDLINTQPIDPGSLGVDYVVLRNRPKLPYGYVYRNDRYVLYDVR